MIRDTKTYTQDEIFLKEIELERWLIRVERAEAEYMNATSSDYISKTIVRDNIRGVYQMLERNLKTMRQKVQS